jgi:hypothetical protein
MDAGKIFVLILIVFVVGLLVFLDMKARRARQGKEALPGPGQQQSDHVQKLH